MISFALTEITIAQGGWSRKLTFAAARLDIVEDHGSRLWYVDTDGIADADVLDRFAASEDIRIALRMMATDGRRFEGAGYFHPNVAHRAAAIRGDGPLAGL